MLCMLIAYNAAGEVVASMDHMVSMDDDGNVTGLVDFEAHEKAGGKLRDIWTVSHAVGSGTWPEWIGGGVLNFKVEVDSGKRITALVHPSGHRRERAKVEKAIRDRIADAKGAPAYIGDIVGGPDKPLILNDDGTTTPRGPKPKRVALPSIARGVGNLSEGGGNDDKDRL